MLCGVSLARGMEIGSGGVWDSPMATDYWVKRFGFMWGGGSSGMSGLKAMQVKQENPRVNIFFWSTCLSRLDNIYEEVNHKDIKFKMYTVCRLE